MLCRWKKVSNILIKHKIIWSKVLYARKVTFKHTLANKFLSTAKILEIILMVLLEESTQQWAVVNQHGYREVNTVPVNTLLDVCVLWQCRFTTIIRKRVMRFIVLIMRLVELIVLLLTLQDCYEEMEGNVIFSFILSIFICSVRLALGRYEQISSHPTIHKSQAWWTVGSRCSPEWVCVFYGSMSISRALMVQTQGNGKAILWSKYECWEMIDLYLKL